MNEAIKLISFEGLPGSAKTVLATLLRFSNLSQKYIFYVFESPTCDSYKTNGDVLNMHLTGQITAFTFETCVIVTRVQNLEKLICFCKSQTDPRQKIILMEQSVSSDLNVYAKMLLQENKLKDYEWFILNQLVQQLDHQVDGVILMCCNLNICLQRLRLRNRVAECDFWSEQRLNSLENCYEQWLQGLSIPVFRCSSFFHIQPPDVVQYREMISELDQFLIAVCLQRSRVDLYGVF